MRFIKVKDRATMWRWKIFKELMTIDLKSCRQTSRSLQIQGVPLCQFIQQNGSTVSSLPRQGKGPALSPDCLGGIGGTVVNTAAFQITWVLGLVSVTREPLWQSGCSLHRASDIPHFVHLWILHRACHFTSFCPSPRS